MIRSTLRSAYDWLGTEPLNYDATSFEAMRDGLALQKEAMDLIAGGEDESCLYPCIMVAMHCCWRWLHWMSRYAPAATRALDVICEKKLADKGFIKIGIVVAAFGNRTTEVHLLMRAYK